VRKAGAEGAKLYHYRAGFGHESVIVAKELGMVTLCDHSIAHPAVLQALVDSRGDLSVLHKSAPMDGFWSDIMDDITQADAVVVNSDFVKQTFLEQGWPSSRVHVIYLGVDDAFLNNVPQRDMQPVKGPLRLMFGGHFNDRKGADVLVEALKDLNDLDWTLEIAGGITPEMRLKHAAFLRDTRVRVLGPVSRAEMASHMALAEVFIFPSFAEGSARVVFEALACGCYVITTINSGSIVQDGVHGRLTPAGNCNALSESIRNANADRESVRAIGQANAELVRQRHRQSRYGEDMSSLYSELLAEK
jgi:glycosyltransferase involved in cell wall biosynthesis